MKKYLFLILGMLLLSSCFDNREINVKEPQKETTIQLQSLAKIDTNYYKVVEKDDVVYILQNDIVVKKVQNQSGEAMTAVFVAFLLGVFIILIIAFSSTL